MRHLVHKKKLSRATDHRVAMERTMADQLVSLGKIETTVDKAKWIRPYVEKLVTKAKTVNGTEDKIKKFNMSKYLKARVRSDTAVRKLIEELAPKYSERKGGYTKITKTGNRPGDNSLKARIEFI